MWLILTAFAQPTPDSAASTLEALTDLDLKPGQSVSIEGLLVPLPKPDLTLPAQERLVPVQRWISAGDVTGWTYVNPAAGLTLLSNRGAISTNYRLTWAPAGMTVLDEAERIAAGLPEKPAGMEAYGPQLPAGTLFGHWRVDPLLGPLMHPDYPDDLQVWVFDGRSGEKARRAEPFPERVWVSLRGCDETHCWGLVLNEPHHLKTIKLQQTVGFRRDAEPLEMDPKWKAR